MWRPSGSILMPLATPIVRPMGLFQAVFIRYGLFDCWALLPTPSAIAAVTPDAEGDIGYSFSLSTTPGNFTVYTLAGLEDRSHTPYTFTPYAMGITRGVPGGSALRSAV